MSRVAKKVSNVCGQAARRSSTTGRCFFASTWLTTSLRRMPRLPRTAFGASDQMLRRAMALDGVAECLTYLLAARLLPEHVNRQKLSRKVVDHHQKPPTKRPALPHGLRQPAHPEAPGDGRHRQICISTHGSGSRHGSFGSPPSRPWCSSWARASAWAWRATFGWCSHSDAGRPEPTLPPSFALRDADRCA